MSALPHRSIWIWMKGNGVQEMELRRIMYYHVLFKLYRFSSWFSWRFLRAFLLNTTAPSIHRYLLVLSPFTLLLITRCSTDASSQCDSDAMTTTVLWQEANLIQRWHRMWWLILRWSRRWPCDVKARDAEGGTVVVCTGNEKYLILLMLHSVW